MKNLFTFIISAILLITVSFGGGLKYASFKDSEKKFKIIGNAVMPEAEIRRLHQIYCDYGDTTEFNHVKGDASLTKYITMDKSVFQSIANYINSQEGSTITGIRFKMIRYDEKYTNAIGNNGPNEYRVRGKKYPFQNSFAIIPMVNGKEDYSLFNKKSLKMIDPGGYNHGDLCPEDCFGESKN